MGGKKDIVNILNYIVSSIIVLTFLLYVVMFLCIVNKKQKCNTYTEQCSVLSDSLKSHVIQDNDSVMLVYFEKFNRSIQDISRRMDSYDTTIDLMIDKSNNWIGFWVGGLSALLALFTIVQVWNNHELKKEDKERFEIIKDNIDSQIKRIKIIENKLLIDTEISKILAITKCMESCPDPAMAFFSEDNREYVKYYFKLLYFEYCNYIKTLKSLSSIENSDLKYYDRQDCIEQTIIMLNTIGNNINVIKLVIFDIDQSLELYILSSSMMECSKKLMKSGMLDKELFEKLDEIRLFFDKCIRNI